MRKFLLAAAVVLLFPAQAFAMTWPYWGQIQQPEQSATRMYPCISGGSTIAQTSGTNARTPVSIDFTFANSRLDVTQSPGIGNSYTAQLFINGVGTSIQMTVSDTAISATDPDLVSITAGQTCYWQFSSVGAVTAGGNFSIAGSATGVNEGEFTIAGGTTGTVSNSANTYIMPGVAVAAGTIETDMSGVVPLSGTMDNMQVELDGTPGGTASYNVYVVQNEATTTLKCTVTSASQTCTNATVLTLTPGDRLSIVHEPVGTPTARRIRTSFRIKPTTNGQAIIWSRSVNPSNGGARFQVISGDISGNNTEFLATTTAPIAFQLSNFWTTVNPAPGALKSWSFIDRINVANGTASTTIAGATATTSSDITHPDNIAAGDLIDFRATPAGTPTAVTKVVESFISFITPASTANSLLIFLQGLWIQ